VQVSSLWAEAAPQKCWQSLSAASTTTSNRLTTCLGAARTLSASGDRPADEDMLEVIVQMTTIYEL
tara:strand:+ start:113 stop:310 length:198 start_codon:yes stop_codon:yes gene_type:complete